jgi:hypothetical protein
MRNKPIKQTKVVYNYNRLEDLINEKYNIYINDFAGKYHLPGNKKAPHWFLEWTKKAYGIKDIDELGQIQIDDRAKYGHWLEEYRDNYEKDEPPYQNFWHFILDGVFGEIANGSIEDVNFVDLKIAVKEPWQLKILDMFIAEFGDKTITIEFSW